MLDNKIDQDQSQQTPAADETPALVECEACGQLFKPEQGYYEDDPAHITYAYCADCCHW